MADRIRKSDTRLKGYVMVEGKRYWVQAYNEDELERKKEEKRAEIKAELDVKLNTSGGNKTVEKWVDEWLELYKEDFVNPRHLKDIRGRMTNWVLPIIGKKRLNAVEQTDIQRIMNKLKGKSPSLINKVYNDVKSLFRQALANRYIQFSPVEGVLKPTAKAAGERRSITDEEREVLVETARAFEGGIFYLIMLYAGLRPSEVAALKWKHVDFKNKVIHVTDALKSDDVIADAETEFNGKTVNAKREVFLSNDLADELKRVFQEEDEPSDEDFVAHKRRKRKDDKHYGHHTKTSMRTMWESFRLAMHIHMGGATDRSIRSYRENKKNENGELESRVVNYTVEIPIEDLVAKDLVPYDLRHTFCTDLRARGVPIEEAKDLMGHADISLTSRIYSHATKTSVERARRLYDGEVSTVKKTKG